MQTRAPACMGARTARSTIAAESYGTLYDDPLVVDQWLLRPWL
jgi:hypothetical protein